MTLHMYSNHEGCDAASECLRDSESVIVDTTVQIVSWGT